MEIFGGYCLTILEVTFIHAMLLILHGLKRILGASAFCVTLGVLLIFAQLSGAAGLTLTLGYPGLDYSLSSSILSLPFLALLIVVYMTDGTLMAQRIIIGMMAAMGCYIYLIGMTLIQYNWPGYSISQGPGSESLAFLLKNSGKLMAATIVSLSVDLFLVPILFQRLVSLRCRLFLTIFGSLLLVQLVDHVIFVSIAFWGTAQWWGNLTSSYLTRAVFVLVISILTTCYLSRIKYETPGESRRVLDIILAFFGAYGKTLRLEQSLRESQERYRLLVQNARDMIIIMSPDGDIIDANKSALSMLGCKTFTDIINKSFCKLTGLQPERWAHLIQDDTPSEGHSISLQIEVAATTKIIDLSIIAIPFENSYLLITFGRDITEQQRIAQEREQWNIQKSHRQRLEAIGRLAGGIAHDFNNYIHAIQGHLDIILLMHDIQDKDVLRNLQKIDHITELAGTLTSQLLGFARKGNYQKTEVELNALVERCAELFPPSTQSGIAFALERDPEIPYILGDPIQLQQTLMNLMINAKDAMKDLPEPNRALTIRIGKPENLKIKLEPPEDAELDKDAIYRVIRVEDTGPGINPEVKHRLFDPFFTTKPAGEGTGMGLAMAYGIVSSHHGWIQVCNLPKRGAAFDIILPEAGVKHKEEKS